MAFAEGFEPEYSQLVAANAELMREIRRADTALISKRLAMETYDQWFLWVAGTWESLLKLANMFEEARRVRPSLRRPGRRAEDAESDRRSPQPPAGEPPSEPPSEPPTDGPREDEDGSPGPESETSG